jgi:hypothetical protein
MDLGGNEVLAGIRDLVAVEPHDRPSYRCSSPVGPILLNADLSLCGGRPRRHIQHRDVEFFGHLRVPV